MNTDGFISTIRSKFTLVEYGGAMYYNVDGGPDDFQFHIIIHRKEDITKIHHLLLETIVSEIRSW